MKSCPKIISRTIEHLREGNCFCLVSHVRPDGDSIGSQLALAEALSAEGKQVTCWNDDPVPAKLAFLDRDHRMQSPKPGQRFDVVIALDVASLERLGTVAGHIRERAVFLNIDHHLSNTRFADLNWVSPRTPSTGELIYRLLREANWPVTPSIANCLFTAVSTDTGSFQYPSTRPTTYAVAGDLVKRGANLSSICNEVYQSYPLSRIRLMQHTLNHFKLTDRNRLAYFWLRPEDFARAGADPSDSEGLIDHIRAIEPVIVACLFEEVEPNLVRISMRSKSQQVDVNAIAQEFDGGGHQAAAGAKISGSPLSVQRRVIKAIRKALQAVPTENACS